MLPAIGVELTRGPARVRVVAASTYGATFEQHTASLRRGSIVPFKIGNDAKGTYTLRVTPIP